MSPVNKTDPGPVWDFDEEGYLAANPDVREAVAAGNPHPDWTIFTVGLAGAAPGCDPAAGRCRGSGGNCFPPPA